MENLLELIKNLPLIINNFACGAIFIFSFCFTFPIATKKNLFFNSVIASFIINLFRPVAIEDKWWLILSVIFAAIAGWGIARICRSEKFDTFLERSNVGRKIHPDFYISLLANKKVEVIVTYKKKESNLCIVGIFDNIESEDVEHRHFCLKDYIVCEDGEEKVAGGGESIILSLEDYEFISIAKE